MASKIVYDPSKPLKYKTPSEKQRAAWKRNWAIRQLRAYYHLVPPQVSRETRAKIQRLIDKELKRFGAESETKREAQRADEMEKYLSGDND